MNDYLADLFEAVQKVDPFKYCLFVDIETLSVEELKERAFCYELYHQFRLIMERKEAIYRNMYLNAEINKSFYDYGGQKQKDRFPDFVLHAGQTKTRKQQFVVEVKRKKNCEDCDIAYDIHKLLYFVSGEFMSLGEKVSFEYGVFIMVGMKEADLRNKFLEEENNTILKRLEELEKRKGVCTEEYLKKIYIMGLHTENVEYYFFSLYDVIKEKKNWIDLFKINNQ